ncbi:MAG: tRNA dihydrouridine synthase DusB [Clostridia bacterium]|nr:tRNA dihydrouridine synthase DusB [Clostridia bacterium]
MTQVRLAPLCGVTDHVFREICQEQGCSQGYTEMVSAMGYLCAPNQRATQDLMTRGAGEKKLFIQLFGRDPDTVAEAAKRMEELGRFDGIDLNMGCPAHKIAPSGEGCGLMRTPDIAEEMMRKTVQAVGLPVSVKMRLGWDAEHINVVEMAHRAESAGVREITIHGRTREQQYSGEANWDYIQQAAESVSIPVWGNGDIFTPEQAIRRAKTPGIAGVMIGRGAMGNPWIFRDIQTLDEGQKIQPVSLEERFRLIRIHYDRMLAWKPEHIAVREMRKHIGWYLHGLRGASRARAEINRAEQPDQVWEILSRLQREVESQEE